MNDTEPVIDLRSGLQYEPETITAKATGYHPVSKNSPEYQMEGGFVGADSWHGQKLPNQEKLYTLDQFRRGEAPYVSVAMDNSSKNPFPYGSFLASPDLPGVPFRVMDTGSAFKGKGTSRIDIARDTREGANSDENNRSLRFISAPRPTGEEIRAMMSNVPRRTLLAGEPTAASLEEAEPIIDLRTMRPEGERLVLSEKDTTGLAITHGLAKGGLSVAAGWSLAAAGDATGFNEAISAMTGPAAALTFGGLNMLEFLGGSLIGDKAVNTAEGALARYSSSIREMMSASKDHPVATQVAAQVPMLPFAWKSAKGYYDLAKAAESVPDAAKILSARVGGGAAAGVGLEAVRPHLENAFNAVGMKLGFTPEEVQQPNIRSFLENAVIGAALNGIFTARIARDTTLTPKEKETKFGGGEIDARRIRTQTKETSSQTQGMVAGAQEEVHLRNAEKNRLEAITREIKTATVEQTEGAPPRPASVSTGDPTQNLRNAMSNVTRSTYLSDVPEAPEKAPFIGAFGAGKGLIKTPFQRWLGWYDQAKQNVTAASGSVARAALKAVPNKDRRRATYNWAAAGGDEKLLQQWADEAPQDTKKAYRDALTLTEKEQSVGKAIRDGKDEQFNRAKELGMLEEAVPDYLKRIVVKRPEAAEELLHGQFRSSASLRTSFPEARKRFWQTMVDAEKEGIRYEKDIGASAFLYSRSFANTAIDRAATKALFDVHTADGRPAIIVGGSGETVGEGDANQALLVKPYGVRRVPGQAAEAAKLKAKYPNWSDDKANAIARENILREYRHVDGAPVLKNWQWIETMEDGTQVLVKGDALVHKSISDTLRNKLATQRIDWLDKYIVRPQAFIKGSKLSLSLFHDVHERVNAAGHLVNSFNVRPLETYQAMPEIQYGLQNGLQMFGHATDAALFAEGMAAHGWPELVPGVGKYVKAYKDVLFENQIPRLKAEMYLGAFARNKSRYPKLNDEQIATLTAKESNATFGEQNYRQMVGKLTSDPRFWQFLQAGFLAPDFGVSKLQHIGQAFTPYGGEQRMALGLVAAGLYTTARFLNYMLDNGNPHFEPEHMFSVIVGDRKYSIRSLPGDMQHLWSDQRSYVYHRLSPGVTTAFEYLTKKDAQGRAIGWSDFVKDVLLSPVPIPLQVTGEKALQTVGIGTPKLKLEARDQLANAIGLSPSLYRHETEVRKWVTKWKEASNNPKLINQVERAQGAVFPPSQYNDMRDALRNSDFTTARSEYLKLVQLQGGNSAAIEHVSQVMKKWSDASFTGAKKYEPAFRKSLTKEQLDVYNEARQERKQTYNNFRVMRRQGVSDLKRALIAPIRGGRPPGAQPFATMPGGLQVFPDE